MAIEKKFVKEGIKESQMEDFLRKRFDRAGYSHTEIQQTPLGTRIIVYANKPGLVIGRSGRRVNEITGEIKRKFGFENPLVDVREVDNPFLDANIVANRIAKALERGIHYKRVCNFYLEKVMEADILVLGSPIYFGSVTGEMQSFLERLQFPFLTYTDPPASIFPGKIRTGFVFTLGADENASKERGFDARIEMYGFILKMIFGNSETLSCYDTYQFDDYSKIYAPRWDPAKKAKRRAEVFPEDCKRAFEMGVGLASTD